MERSDEAKKISRWTSLKNRRGRRRPKKTYYRKNRREALTAEDKKSPRLMASNAFLGRGVGFWLRRKGATEI